MRAYLLPFGDCIAWCLMPNHFHWLFYVKKVEIARKELRRNVDEVEYSRRVQKFGKNAQYVDYTQKRNADENSLVGLNIAIGYLQKAYARAINKERKMSGSLFRTRCKAKDGWIDEFVTLERKGGKADSRFLPGTDYGFHCLNYIHSNPVIAGLVNKNEEWEYSSARDYSGSRVGSLCNIELGKQLINFI
jgi:putative transposase